MFTMDMFTRCAMDILIIDLQIVGHFEFLPFLPKNGRVESISTVSVITRGITVLGRNLPTLSTPCDPLSMYSYFVCK